jgi:hypothetical protein
MSQLKYYDISSGTWLPAVVGAQGPTGPQGEVGPTGPSGESALADLIDVSVAFATNGSVLAYNTDSSLWEATQIRDLVLQVLIESGAIGIDGGSYNTTTFAGTIDGGSYNTTSFTTIYDGGSAGSI